MEVKSFKVQALEVAFVSQAVMCLLLWTIYFKTCQLTKEQAKLQLLKGLKDWLLIQDLNLFVLDF